jgi:hypothetical protein
VLCERESVSPIVSAATRMRVLVATASAVCRRLIDAVRRSLRMNGLPTDRSCPQLWSTVCTVTVAQGTLIRELVGKLDHHVEMQAQLRNALNSVRTKYPVAEYSRRLLCGTSWPQQHSVVRPQAHVDAAQPLGYSCVLYRRIGATANNRAGKPLPQLLFVCLHNRKTWTRC